MRITSSPVRRRLAWTCEVHDGIVHETEIEPRAVQPPHLAVLWEAALSTPEDVAVSGFSGRYAAVTVPCGAATRYWVLDVGGQTLVIIAHVWMASSPDEAAELQDIVDSIQIDANP